MTYRKLNYLKRFNEAIEETKLTEEQIEELKDFCETSLVYLLDEDFELNIDSRFPGLERNSQGFNRECIILS